MQGFSTNAEIEPIGKDPRPLHQVLLESRERWRDFAMLASDVVFEADVDGRICLINPSPAFGYAKAVLMGCKGSELLVDGPGAGLFNPFQPEAGRRRGRAWLRQANGQASCYSFSIRQLVDEQGTVIGTRGVAVDITASDEHESAVAGALRRVELLEHILRRMREETLAPRMLQAVLEALMNALGAGGSVVLNRLPDSAGCNQLHAVGTTPSAVLKRISEYQLPGDSVPLLTTSAEGHSVLICPNCSRFRENVILSLWRDRDSRPWDLEDGQLAASVTSVLGVVLEHETMEFEMARQARTDWLTGLLNRRAFIEDVGRRLQRSERENTAGVLMYIDLDHFKWLNDIWGHEAGDECLSRFASLLRYTFRPADLVARLGGDEFAVWMDGSDQFAAAERAEQIRIESRAHFSRFANGEEPHLGASIGMACRPSNSREGVDSLMRRADLAMYEIKRNCKGSWLISRASAAE